jgi:hypothetical protein
MNLTDLMRCALLLSLTACSGNITSEPGASPGDVAGSPGATVTLDPQALDPLSDRKLDYNLALRTAALKLVGSLPTMDQIVAVQTAADPAAVYARTIEAYLADRRFPGQLVAFFRDMMRTGAEAGDTAPTFAAMVVNSNRPFSDVLTATSGTCPSLDPKSGVFTAASCTNNVPKAAGVLTDPSVMSLWYGSLAFRRTRWAQESFVCRKFPAELVPNPEPKGNGQYTSPWPFTSIPDQTSGRINFRDTSSTICANCHTTINHIAPLFANFNADGTWQDTIQVTVPIANTPTAQRTDWLVAGEVTSWRHGEPVADLPALGRAMAQDPDVAACAVARVYNWAMSRGDVVGNLAGVPDDLLAPYLTTYTRSGGRLKDVIRQAFTSDDFVRF